MSSPRLIYHLEGFVIAAAGMTTYFLMHESAALFALLILAPDLGMLGYLINPTIGSISYNVLHSYAWPIIIGFLGVTMGYPLFTPIALIWATHIGADRLLGFGLKYPTGFKDVDVQRI